MSKNTVVYKELPLLVSPANTLIKVLNKNKLFKLLKQKKYILKTYDPLIVKPNDFINRKLFVKPAIGRGSKGCEKINNFTKLKSYLNNNKNKLDELIFTKFCEGKEWSVDMIINNDGNSLLSISRTRIIKNGNPISGQCIKNLHISGH
ncbi:hypothetical protein A2531_05740 [Candidatus Falkowbacteria bacterium RIFOXYD2_FULL_34_120]|uniref:ATP-grasp fold PylC-type domain-containing protein n=1 Tax=Candidatus Falkowbacteria bacterium RIFOXYD2_FULL_34_120 TaxID=1798007 RepID=A0A1F5TSI1_9BACT|nr:MAG: hypothetical protein A2466_00570 [Candidatus Falkowbacteria bacterium RIFOXYC2_FULL_34_220]OGF39190.1 MAG: hypothetical protein A2515_01080 [Candidatus Falkowbacteria bacterium RIFOXYD12_FULL_34_57]OGF41757.1 MAG: hypothetical protein A2531_05740 [Candidatus Falkowbacteria bacterium RIFOXYD2_FULL_34_120]